MRTIGAAARFLVFALFPIVAIADEPSPPATGPLDPALMIEVFELLIGQGAFVPCLSVDEHDPPRSVIDALVARKHEVFPVSECTYRLREPGAFHNATKRKAMFHMIAGFKEHHGGGATLEWRSYHHGLYGAGGTCTLSRKDGVWHVEACQQGFVS